DRIDREARDGEPVGGSKRRGDLERGRHDHAARQDHPDRGAGDGPGASYGGAERPRIERERAAEHESEHAEPGPAAEPAEGAGMPWGRPKTPHMPLIGHPRPAFERVQRLLM